MKVAIWEGSSLIYVGYLCIEYAAYTNNSACNLLKLGGSIHDHGAAGGGGGGCRCTTSWVSEPN